MALTLSPSPWFTALDDSGDPISGALIYTYLAGTSTPQATYSDVDGLVANANPVVCDAAGRCVMYLLPTSYKFVYKTAAGVTIRPQDNVSAVPAVNVDLDISGTAGEVLAAGEVVYLSAGSGGKTAGKWYLADADNTYSSSEAKSVGFAINAYAADETATIRIQGRITGLSGLTAGTTYYISATAGALTSSAPANARAVLVADSTTSGVLSFWLSIQDASETVSGIVNITTQTFGGAKTFADRVTISPRTPIPNDLTDHATSGTGATDVWTNSATNLAAGAVQNGETLVLEAFGDQTADANTKTYTFTLGSTTFTVGGVTSNNANWWYQVRLTRVSASVQRAIVHTVVGVGTAYFLIYVAGTENMDNALALKFTLRHETAGTTTMRVLRAWVEPAP